MVLKERDDCTFSTLVRKTMPKGAELAPAVHLDEAVHNRGGGAEKRRKKGIKKTSR